MSVISEDELPFDEMAPAPPKPPPMCAHHKPHGYDYQTAHADAQERLAKGERQTQCRTCKLWFWKDEIGRKK